jgi:hypothetical protein
VVVGFGFVGLRGESWLEARRVGFLRALREDLGGVGR